MPIDRVRRWRALLGVLGLLLSIGISAATLESLVMPGPVIEGHAEFEHDCANCHDVFNRSAQPQLCLECHEAIARDLDLDQGFHSRQPAARSEPCKRCHTEHEGRDADIVGLQPALFDHSMSDFPLVGAHAEPGCADCHETGKRFAEAPSECVACHQDDDAHGGTLGDACGDCHEPTDWPRGSFDHATTDFALTGGHAGIACLSCHVDGRFEPVGTGCIDCHRLDDTHGGSRGDDCGDCHRTESWEAKFDHQRETGFALVAAHAELSCRNCHVGEKDLDALPTDCQGCHSSDDAHLGRNGPGCGGCHAQSSWKIAFDHFAETGYALEGAHRDLACTACHVGALADPLPNDCAGCHAVDDPHDGTLKVCGDCHEQNDWMQVPRFQHDLTDFALVGMHRSASCEQCHASLAFSPQPGNCDDCHAVDDVHKRGFGVVCEDCHNPVGWSFWMFDHDQRTDFALDGAHADLACDACHAPGTRANRQASACAACHHRDDVHRGGFGQQCDRCHDSTTFSQPAMLN
jgi:hypothetical protein